ncbi:retrovirus-related Pol polyprotein from transposon 17.6 [Trichonephila clavipes]|nr:retrovirus-related Pol polyprotein from transposon 17.6 [Trichonephila clavipes]
MNGVVALGYGGHVLVLLFCATKNVGVVALGMEVMCWFSGPAPQNNVSGMKEGRWKIKTIQHLPSFEYFVRAGVVALSAGGHVLVLRSCATKECGWYEGGAGIVALGDGGHVLFSGPEPQKNVNGMRKEYFVMARFVVVGDGGHVLVHRSCTTKECEWAGFVALGDGGHVLVLLSCATKECEWSGVFAHGDEGHVLVLLSCATKECECAGIVALGDGGHVLFSGPEPQKNVNGMRKEYFVMARFVVVGDGGHVLVHRSCTTKECEWAGFVALGDGGHVLVLLSCATKECEWSGVFAHGDEGHVLVLLSCATKECEWSGVVARGDGGHVLVLLSCATKELWVAGVVALGDGGHVLVLRSCATKECGWAGVVGLSDGGHVLGLRSCATKKNEVKVITDHAALTKLTNGENLSSRMIRWALKLSELNIEWENRSGVQNVVADVLSRNPVGHMDGSQISSAALRALALNSREQLFREQREDPELGHIYRYLENPNDGSINATICEEVFEHLSHRLDIKHMKTVTYRPQANLTERVNRNLVQMIASFVKENHENWDRFLHEFAFALHTSVKETTNKTPAELFLGRKITTHFSKLINVTKGAQCVGRNIEKLFDEARQNRWKQHKHWEKYYNRKRRKVNIKVNDLVLEQTHFISDAGRRVVGKFMPKFEGPYRVLEVRNINIIILKRFKKVTVNIDQVRVYRPRQSDTISSDSYVETLYEGQRSSDRSSRSQPGKFKGSRKTSSEQNNGHKSSKGNAGWEDPRLKRKVDSNGSGDRKNIKKTKICRKRSLPGSEHRDHKRPTPEPKQRDKKSNFVLSFIS